MIANTSQTVEKVKTLRILPSNTHKGFTSALCCAKLSFRQMALLCHCTLTLYKPREYGVYIKVFGLAFYKKQAGLGSAQGLTATGTEGFMRLNEAISKRLEEILISQGMTQYELFKKSGVPRSTIGNVMNCSYDSVKLRIIHEMCLGLEIGIGEFFTSPLFDENNLED